MYLQSKNSKKCRVGTRQLANLRDQLKRFAQDHGREAVHEITTAKVDAWLSCLRSRRNPTKQAVAPLLSALSKNHHRATLHAFFGYAVAPARAWIDRNPLADLEPERVATSEPEAYSVTDTKQIFKTALEHKPDLVPILALGFFCGLRVSEALRVDLEKLFIEASEFRVTGKTGARLAPLTETASAWLNAQERRSGKAWLKSQRALVDQMRELFALASVKQIGNGARHSFISYRTAETRDVARVADECGNSVSMVKNHYRKLVTTEAATEFFLIRPDF